MGKRTIVLLTIIQLVILLRANGGSIDNCLIPHGSNTCSCCKSGYRGPTCSDDCQHCLTRDVPWGECTYYCETGYYGKTCDKECPHTCADGNNGPNLCKEKHGSPVCVECIPGFYGKQCDQTCDTNCQERTCYQTDGKCLSCSSNRFYGDHCRLPCSQGCVSGRCNRTGHCTQGCKFGFYGERCESLCGSTCKQGKCSSHGYHAYNCTEGCNGGYWRTPCLEECPNHCTECEQQSGRCSSCVENYVMKPKTGECVSASAQSAAIRDVGIWVLNLIFIVVIGVIFIYYIIIIRRRQHRRRNSSNRSPEDRGLLPDVRNLRPHGNASIVEQLLPSFDINSRGQNGWTPVMKAAYRGKKEVVYLLVRMKADLTLTDNYGDTVLHLSCRRGNTSIVEHLLPSFDINSRGMDGWTPVMNAAYSGKKELFDLLVTKGADFTLTGSTANNILHQACTGGNIGIVRYMLPLYDVNVKGCNSHTPLMTAVCEGHIEVVDLLLSNNADVTLVDDDGDSLLHLASESGNLAMVKHVFPFSDINLKDKLGLTPLMLAVLNGKLNVFQFLVDKGTSLDLVDNVGDDILTLAYRGGCKEIILQLTPCGEEIQTIEKWTKLMYHVAFGHWNVLKKTQQDSPELVQRDGFGDTLLLLACRGGNLQCVEYLLPSYDINVRGRYGWTPVMMAARCGHMDVLQCLISHKADLSLVSDKGEDGLCLARQGTNTDIVTFLLTLPDFSDTE